MFTPANLIRLLVVEPGSAGRAACQEAEAMLRRQWIDLPHGLAVTYATGFEEALGLLPYHQGVISQLALPVFGWTSEEPREPELGPLLVANALWLNQLAVLIHPDRVPKEIEEQNQRRGLVTFNSYQRALLGLLTLMWHDEYRWPSQGRIWHPSRGQALTEQELNGWVDGHLARGRFEM